MRTMKPVIIIYVVIARTVTSQGCMGFIGQQLTNKGHSTEDRLPRRTGILPDSVHNPSLPGPTRNFNSSFNWLINTIYDLNLS